MFNLVVYLVALIAHVDPAASSGSNKLSVTDSAQGFGKVIKLKADLRAALLEICQSKNADRLNQAQAAAYQPREGESKIPIKVCLHAAC
jgi:ribosomal protein S12 methylthiotransferase accessory factor YcaO